MLTEFGAYACRVSFGVQPSAGKAHLGADVGPVDAVLGHVEVQGRGLLDAGEGDGHVVAVGAQRDAADVGAVGEEQEGLGHHAGAQVAQQLQAHGAGAAQALRPVEAQVAAAAVQLGTAIGSWEKRRQGGRRRAEGMRETDSS